MNLLKMISEYVNTLRKFQVVKDTNTWPVVFLAYLYFKVNRRLITIDLSKQEARDADNNKLTLLGI